MIICLQFLTNFDNIFHSKELLLKVQVKNKGIQGLSTVTFRTDYNCIYHYRTCVYVFNI